MSTAIEKARALREQQAQQKAEVLKEVLEGIRCLNELGGSDIPDDSETEGQLFLYSLRLGLRTIDIGTGKLKPKVENGNNGASNGAAKKTKGKSR